MVCSLFQIIPSSAHSLVAVLMAASFKSLVLTPIDGD
jgi:hypothetical protein